MVDFVKMADSACLRFAVVDEETISKSKTANENENTRKSTNLWLSVLTKWEVEKKTDESLLNLSSLRKVFYKIARVT